MAAVEFIAQELSKQIDNDLFMEVTFNKLLEKAKVMEKEQKIEFAKHFLYKCKDLSIVMAYNQVEQELIKHELNKSE